ncbi:hypothetical protein [Microvirga roseola]|uniref:hypothetical protein n=1 Tax=Microvirga roseola TaxID=2883126 RepID=UPI001E64FCB4|nr:hypothetical protein [Microvirga roseola]
MAEDRAKGLAAQSVKASIRHPNQSSPDHQEQGDLTQSNRSLTGNDEPADKKDADSPSQEDRYKP